MKELERKDTPGVGGGSYTPPTYPDGVPIIMPTNPPTPGFPQVPAPGIDPTGNIEKF